MSNFTDQQSDWRAAALKQIESNLGAPLQEVLQDMRPSNCPRVKVDVRNRLLLTRLVTLTGYCGGHVPSFGFWGWIRRALNRRPVKGGCIELNSSDAAYAIEEAKADEERRFALGSTDTMSMGDSPTRGRHSPEPTPMDMGTPTVYQKSEELDMATIFSSKHDMRSGTDLGMVLPLKINETSPGSASEDINKARYSPDPGLQLDEETNKKTRPSRVSAKKVPSYNLRTLADAAFKATEDPVKQQQPVFKDRAPLQVSPRRSTRNIMPKRNQSGANETTDPGMTVEFLTGHESPERIRSSGKLVEPTEPESKEDHGKDKAPRPLWYSSKIISSYNLRSLADNMFDRQTTKTEEDQKHSKGNGAATTSTGEVAGSTRTGVDSMVKPEPQREVKKKPSCNAAITVTGDHISRKRTLPSDSETKPSWHPYKKQKPRKEGKTPYASSSSHCQKDRNAKRKRIEIKELIELDDFESYEFPVEVRDPRHKGTYDLIENAEDLREAVKDAKRRLGAQQRASELVSVAEPSATPEKEDELYPFIQFLRDSTEKSVQHTIHTMIESLKFAAPRPLTPSEHSQISKFETKYLVDMKKTQARFEKGIQKLDIFHFAPSEDSNTNAPELSSEQDTIIVEVKRKEREPKVRSVPRQSSPDWPLDEELEVVVISSDSEEEAS